jgi:hypothetical protein
MSEAVRVPSFRFLGVAHPSWGFVQTYDISLTPPNLRQSRLPSDQLEEVMDNPGYLIVALGGFAAGLLVCIACRTICRSLGFQCKE